MSARGTPWSERARASVLAPKGRSRAATAAGIVFVVALVIAIPLYLVRGNEQWFFLDDWDFLAARDLSWGDLMRPHNEHWSTLPILVYRLLWRFVGLRSYVPYQVVLVTLHLVAAVLLRKIMRRAEVGAWIATAAALLFVFLGSGRQNIVWAFQIGFVGALVCGLAHLMLADHDGKPDRRDAYGIAFGFAGLLCSGVAVTMTIIVGMAVLLRRGWRGWRVAALHTVPIGAVYLLWFFGYGRDAYETDYGAPDQMWRFVTTGLGNALSRLGQVPGAGLVLGLLLVVGLVVAWTGQPFAEVRRRAAAPAALLLGAVVFVTIAGFGRQLFGPDGARASRYVHLLAAMLLPAIAVAADALARRWRWMLPVVLVVLLVGIPGNIDDIQAQGFERLTLGSRETVLNIAATPFADQLPRSTRLDAVNVSYATLGWLLDAERAGRLPAPSDASLTREAAVTLGLTLEQRADGRPGAGCQPVEGPVPLELEAGDGFVFRDGPLDAHLRLPDGKLSPARRFAPANGTSVVARGGPITIIVQRPPLGGSLMLCRTA